MTPSWLYRSADGYLPSEEEVVTAAEVAPARLQQPEHGLLQQVPNTDAPILDRPAVRAVSRKQALHEPQHCLAPCCRFSVRQDGPTGCPKMDWRRQPKLLRQPPAGALPSHAAVMCPGACIPGKGRRTFAVVRATWRWRIQRLPAIPESRACPYALGSSTTEQIIASVVSMSEAMEAAFCRAERVTLVGSITPALTRSSYSSVEALKP